MPESEARKEYKKKWREEHKDHIKEYTKQYYLNNRDKELAKSKAYAEANQDMIKERKAQLVACDRCGEYVQKYKLPTHQKTNKCMNFSNKDFKKDSVYCPLCGSIVSDKGMSKHQQSQKCKKIADKLKTKSIENQSDPVLKS